MKAHRLSRKQAGRFLLTLFVLMLLPCSSALAGGHTLKAVSAWPKNVYEVQNYLKLIEIIQDKVDQNYPGELKIQYIGGPEVFPNREQVEAARNGLVDMVFTTVGYYVSALPVVDGLNLTRLKPWEERKQGVNAFLETLHQEAVNCFYLGRGSLYPLRPSGHGPAHPLAFAGALAAQSDCGVTPNRVAFIPQQRDEAFLPASSRLDNHFLHSCKFACPSPEPIYGSELG